MEELAKALTIGVTNGLIIALIAIGYTLVYGILELINFAHADVFMLGTAFTYFMTNFIVESLGVPAQDLAVQLIEALALVARNVVEVLEYDTGHIENAVVSMRTQHGKRLMDVIVDPIALVFLRAESACDLAKG